MARFNTRIYAALLAAGSLAAPAKAFAPTPEAKVETCVPPQASNMPQGMIDTAVFDRCISLKAERSARTPAPRQPSNPQNTPK